MLLIELKSDTRQSNDCLFSDHEKNILESTQLKLSNSGNRIPIAFRYSLLFVYRFEYRI